jgi:hypothetical protein
MTRLQLRNLRIYLLFVLCFAAFGAFLYHQFGPPVAGYVAVAFVSIVLRDIGYFRRSVRIWPILQQVLNWPKIEQLVSSKESSKS